MSWEPPKEEMIDDATPQTPNWAPPEDELATDSGTLDFAKKLITEDLNPFHIEGSVLYQSQEDELKDILGNVDFESGPSWMERFDYGMQDNPEEIANKFMQDHPSGEIKKINTSFGPRIMYKEQYGSDEPWKPVNESGVSIGDISGAIPSIVTGVGAAVATGGLSVPVQLGATFLGTFLGEMGRQGYQTSEGTQTQELSDQLYQSSVTASMDMATGGVFHLGARFLPYPRANISTEQKAMVVKIQEAFPELSDSDAMLMAHQIAYDAPQLVTQAKQAAALHRAIPEASEKQAKFALEQAEKIEGVGGSISDIQDILRRSADKWSMKETKLIVGGMPDVRELGILFKQAIGDDFISKSRREITEAYKSVDKIASKENPIFNISGVQDEADALLNGIQGDTVQVYGPANTMMGDTTDGIAPKTFEMGSLDVSSDPSGALTKIASDIKALHGIQPDYNTLKSFRTRLSNIKSSHRFTNDNNKRLADRLYHSITDSLNNPINGAPNFSKAHTKASNLAGKKFELLDNQQIASMLQSDTPADIVGWMMKPGNLHSDVRAVLHKYAPDKVDKIKSGILRRILVDKSMKPIEIIKSFDLNDHKTLQWLAGGKSGIDDVYDMAYDIERINSVPWEPVALAQTDAIKALDLIASPEQAKIFINQIGEREAKVFYREVMLKDVIERSIKKNHKTGGFYVDDKILGESLRKYDKNGLSDLLLTPYDKQRIEALSSYVQLTGAKGTDFGVALVTNQLTGKYRSSVAKMNLRGIMDARLQGLYATMLSKLIASPKGNLALLRGLGKPAVAYKARSVGIMASALAAESLGDSGRKLDGDIKPAPTVAPKPPVSGLNAESFEPPQQQAPITQPTSYLPPSMRDQGSVLGQVAQQRQGFSDGGIAGFYNEVLGDVYNNVEMLSDEPLPMDAMKNMNKFMRITKDIESEGGVINPKSSARGSFQITAPTVETNMRRFKRDGYQMPQEEVLSEFPKEIMNLPISDQGAMALKNIWDHKLSSQDIEDVMRTGSPDAMFNLYMEHHHTGNDEETKNRARKFFGVKEKNADVRATMKAINSKVTPSKEGIENLTYR